MAMPAVVQAPLRGVLWLCLLLASLALFLPGQFSLPPIDRDEARFAQASKQMLETGDFVDIRFQYEARHKKPAGIYWLQSASVAVLSPQDLSAIWAYRVPSWLGATAAVLLTAWVGTCLFGAETGLLAALLLAGCALLGVEARMAKTDAVLLATVVAAQGALARVWRDRDQNQPADWPTVLTFWGAQSLGILIKGPIVPLVSALTLLGLWVGERRFGWCSRLRPGVGLVLTLLLVAPWLVLITLTTKGAFFAESVGHDMLGKVAGAQEAHGMPPGFYLIAFWITFTPFAMPAVLSLPWVWEHRRDAVVRFALAWIIPIWIVFELIPTKLPHYTLPVFPAVALLVAAAARDNFATASPRRWLWPLASGLGLITALLLPLGIAALPWLVEKRLDVAAAAAAAVASGLFLLGWLWLRRRRTVPGLLVTLLAVGVLYGAAFQRIFPGLESLWLTQRVAAVVAEQPVCAAGRMKLTSAGFTEPSLVFLTDTHTRLYGDGGLAARYLLTDPACTLALVEAQQEETFRAWLQAHGGGAEPEFRSRVTGFNYSKGGRVSLTLYALRQVPPFSFQPPATEVSPSSDGPAS